MQHISTILSEFDQFDLPDLDVVGAGIGGIGRVSDRTLLRLVTVTAANKNNAGR